MRAFAQSFAAVDHATSDPRSLAMPSPPFDQWPFSPLPPGYSATFLTATPVRDGPNPLGRYRWAFANVTSISSHMQVSIDIDRSEVHS